jgi:hypothetical protein
VLIKEKFKQQKTELQLCKSNYLLYETFRKKNFYEATISAAEKRANFF